MNKNKIEGIYTALVTPFKQNKIDFLSMEKMMNFQIEEGVDGFVLLGTTGEAPTISSKEREDIGKWANLKYKGKITLISGTGHNNTQEAIRLSMEAEYLGYDMIMVAPPYYNKPTQRGIYSYFQSIACRVSCPIILYHVPGRTGVNIDISTAQELHRKYPHIIAVKEASGDISSIDQWIQRMGPHFSVLSGDDGLSFPSLALGGSGVISVASNIIPKALKEGFRYILEGKLKEARDIHQTYSKLMGALFMESNPIPVKYALFLLSFLREEYRAPMEPMEDINKAKLKEIMKEIHLI